MSSLEQTLAAVLQAEVDKRISLVQQAADAWVAAFAASALALARGDLQALPATHVAPVPLQGLAGAPVALTDAMEPSSIPPEALEEIGGLMQTYTVTDAAASFANMAVQR